MVMCSYYLNKLILLTHIHIIQCLSFRKDDNLKKTDFRVKTILSSENTAKRQH